MTRLVLYGGGRMGEALLSGIFTSGWGSPGEVAVVEPNPARATTLRDRYPGLTVESYAMAAEGAVLATKPTVIDEAAAALRQVGGAARVLSIAAGVTLAQLEATLAPGTAVIRAMPNTPALVGAGVSAIALGTHAMGSDRDWADTLLSSVGTVVHVAEDKLDAVTGLSGSGPAYVFLVAEALAEAGVLVGLDRHTATQLANQTLLGSARLLIETDDSAADLRAAVTSPGGTTAEGLRALEMGGVRSAFLEAVVAATSKSTQLGKPAG